MKTGSAVSMRFDNIDYATFDVVVYSFPRNGIRAVALNDFDGFIGVLPSGVKAAILIKSDGVADGLCIALDQFEGRENYLDVVAARVLCDDDGLPGILPLYVCKVQGLGIIGGKKDDTIN